MLYAVGDRIRWCLDGSNGVDKGDLGTVMEVEGEKYSSNPKVSVSMDIDKHPLTMRGTGSQGWFHVDIWYIEKVDDAT